MMIDDFLNYLRYERNRSDLTVRNYERSLRDFESYFKNRESHLSWESVDSDIIRDWMESMMDKGDMASSVNNRLSAVRSFFRFVLSRGMVDVDPAIIILFYETGIRLAELIGLNEQDVDFGQHQLKVTGKRNKQRIIPFGEELEQVLKDYIRQRDEQPLKLEPALLLNDKGCRFTRSQVGAIVKRHLSRVTTMKKRSPHVLRHSFATAMLNHGAELESVRHLLGHESVATTEIYTHTTFEQLKKVYENAHPRA